MENKRAFSQKEGPTDLNRPDGTPLASFSLEHFVKDAGPFKRCPFHTGQPGTFLESV